MVFKRDWDASCPRVWDSWEDNGTTWVIRDIPPEDDEQAVELLIQNFLKDDVLCSLSDVLGDPESVRGARLFWRCWIGQRVSLGCYEEKNGQSKLVALNVCAVHCKGEDPNYVIEGKAWNNVIDALKVCSKLDTYTQLGVDRILYGLGLVVSREYRGARLGARILDAREPMCRQLGVAATSTVFTGPASQRSAERAGFSTALVVSLSDLADAGLDYPRDESRHLKLMRARAAGTRTRRYFNGIASTFVVSTILFARSLRNNIDYIDSNMSSTPEGPFAGFSVIS